MDGDSIARLIEQVKQGSADESSQELFDRYFGRLVALARAKLRSSGAVWHDEEDVALSAMKSFLVRARAGNFPNLNDADELWPLLVTITLRKVYNARRHQFADRRDLRRQRSLDDDLSNNLNQQVADQVVQLGNELLESLVDEKLRRIAQMKLEGYTNAEIAEKIGRSVKTVEWKLRLIRTQLTRSIAADDDSPAS